MRPAVLGCPIPLGTLQFDCKHPTTKDNWELKSLESDLGKRPTQCQMPRMARDTEYILMVRIKRRQLPTKPSPSHGVGCFLGGVCNQHTPPPTSAAMPPGDPLSCGCGRILCKLSDWLAFLCTCCNRCAPAAHKKVLSCPFKCAITRLAGGSDKEGDPQEQIDNGSTLESSQHAAKSKTTKFLDFCE